MLRTYDAFARPIEGLRKRSVLGGVISILALTAASILFLLQIYMYVQGETRQDLLLATSMASSYIPPLNKQGTTFQPIVPASAGSISMAMQEARMARSKIPFKFQVIFPFIECRHLEVVHDEARGRDFEKLHGKHAYRKNTPNLQQLKQTELFAPGQTFWKRPGCVVWGTLQLLKVGGTISIGVTQEAWNDAIMFANLGYKDPKKYPGEETPGLFNISHYIEYMEFGEIFPLSHNPLKSSRTVIDNQSGMGIQHINVKLVPTQYKRTGRGARDMYQVSVAQHTIQPDILAEQHSTLMPGMVVYYDFTPLAVHHTHERENVLVFLSSLISIFGGAFVTVGLISRCLVSAASIAKKMD